MSIIDPLLLDKFITVCERAAFGASKFRGKNDKTSADHAAVDETVSYTHLTLPTTEAV